MPHPEQTRKERIEALLKWCNDNEINGYLAIQNKAFAMYPFMGEGTVRGYAKAVYRMLKATHIKEKEKDKTQ